MSINIPPPDGRPIPIRKGKEPPDKFAVRMAIGTLVVFVVAFIVPLAIWLYRLALGL